MRDLEKPSGNARIAAALLDVLTASGHGAARNRAERALEDGSPPRRRRTDWIEANRVRDAFRVAQADAQVARRVGRVLVAPQAIGLLLSFTGIATPEKAYRRCDHLLPRDQPGDRFEAVQISQGNARIAFYPSHSSPSDVLFCDVRIGMLEAMPPLYGLLPALVKETACAHRGAPACVYELTWRRTPRSGLVLGSLAGGLLGAAAGAGLGLLAGLAGSLAIAVALIVSLAGAAAGRSVDLARQLDALAKGGLGHLALLDQADGVLAEKMDQLAKLDGAGQSPQVERSLGSAPLRAPAQETSERGVVQRLRQPVASLQRALEELRDAATRDDADALSSGLEDCAALVRELEMIGAAGRDGDTGAFETADLAQIVRRGVAAAEAHGPNGLAVNLSIGPDPAPVSCQPFQIEQIVVQLVTNAVEAVQEGGRVDVELRRCTEGFELAVSDDGEGIDPETLDSLFDPFFDGSPDGAATDGGLGLTICYRIAKAHGGELAVHAEPGHGTRIAVVLPLDGG